MPFQDFLSGILEDRPELSFFADVNRFARSPRQRRFLSSQYQPTFNKYLGQLGQQLQGGRIPTLRFQDFLSETPFTERFAAMPPSFRGQSFARFRPRTRSLFNF